MDGDMSMRRIWCSLPALISSACLQPGGGAESPSGTSPEGEAASDPGTETHAAGTPYVWKNVPILGGGFVTGVIFSELEQDLVYARTDIGGAYRWDKQDQSWIPITDGLNRDESNFMGVESLAIDPKDPEKVYLAVGTYTQDWAGTGAFMRSSDRGKTWQTTPVAFKMGGNENGRSNGERLAVDPGSPNIVYFGSRKNGLWKSEDGAANWKQVESFPDAGDTGGVGLPIVVFAPAKAGAAGPSKVIYVAASNREKSLFRSQDGGATWKPVLEQPTGFVPSHLDFDAAGTLFVSYGNQPGPSDVTDGAVFSFTPSSSKWTDVTPLKPSAADKFGYGGLSADPRRAGHVICSSIDRWTNKDEVFRTTDGGKTWQKLGQTGNWHSEGATYLLHGKEKASITHWTGDVDLDPFNADRATVVGGTGVFMTDNLGRSDGQPVDWRFTNKGLEETAVSILVSPPVGAPLISGVGDICGFRHDELDKAPAKGAHSKPSCNGTTGLDFAEKQPSFVVRAGRVWGEDPHGAYSTDGGSSWTAFPKEPPGSATGGALAVSSDGGSIVWSIKTKVPMYSRDRGATWAAVTGVREGSKLPDWTSMDLQPAADRENPNLLYIYDAQQGGVYVSRDGAKSFAVTYTGLPGLADYQLGSASINAVPGFEGHIWITTGKELYRSTDAGKTVEHVSSVSEGYGLGLGKAAPGHSYPALYLSGLVGQKKGFYRSDDIGRSWARINDDAHQFGSVNLVEGDPRVYGRVYLGTGGRGILYGMPNDSH